MPVIVCPRCGEDEELSGRREDGRILLSCQHCGAEWDRDVTPRCNVCGSDDLHPVHTSTIEEAGRGAQRTPSGIRIAYVCWSCGARDATSSEPLPPAPGWESAEPEPES
ncbi:MAG: hypothetical protein KY469_18150 [Actinobacteria bacterium]|nr:hypothetical protein [Actinomycetota bacterium]